jgi:hypothetical protein
MIRVASCALTVIALSGCGSSEPVTFRGEYVIAGERGQTFVECGTGKEIGIMLSPEAFSELMKHQERLGTGRDQFLVLEVLAVPARPGHDVGYVIEHIRSAQPGRCR